MRLLFVFLLLSGYAGAQLTQISPVKHGHAHNDYMHVRPLSEALENGFTSIEIDVFLYKGELRVSHLDVGLNKKKTIEQLYLDPIKKIIAQNGGHVYKGFDTTVIFMIDFKTEGIETYHKLKEILRNYQDIISVYRHDAVYRKRPISILISGNNPMSEVLKEDTAFATIDADISTMKLPALNKAITRYSSSWGSYFTWSGNGTISAGEKEKLDSLVAKAHALKKQIRFYGIPDKSNVWKTLLDAGVDWINTDKLDEYRRFAEERATQ